MKKLLFTLIILLFSFPVLRAQEPGNDEATELKTLYKSLEYNTLAFDDLKQKWMVDDPTFIREIFNRFVVRNALRLNGRTPKVDVVKEKTKLVQDGEVTIEVRKRYYDDEMEFFAFYPSDEIGKDNPKPLFDPIYDGFLLKDIIGEKTYDKIREITYFYKETTKEQTYTKQGYNFEVNLNALRPEVSLWNVTTEGSNKYLVSLFGQWGSDKALWPGWYSNEYFLGARLTYFKSISNDPDKFTYRLSVGAGVPSNRPYKDDMKVDRLWVSTQAVYGKLEGYPFAFIDSDFMKDILFSLEAKITITPYKTKDFGKFNQVTDFFSNKTIVNWELRKRNITDVFNLGQLEVGLIWSSSDIFKLRLDPTKSEIIDREAGRKTYMQKFNHIISLEVGLRKNAGLVQHAFDLAFGYGTDGYGYYGLKGFAMITGNFGLDVGVYNSFGLDKKKYPYRYDTYIVFSPILRINY
ncbi:MAG: hypothetical protein LC102_00660 [Ignavibacteriales bacterium]|nr:MAG: hypothetical protein F9K26_03620 [Ignavibacteriaceae bacterium]MBW7872523.1 hypothetical protein [Ignavibacteria bacterium]MCZ2141924.1 hypothetical protein [Ignavibacteriales bacterium]OQY79542.1 MAG: hypothetical protein B6D45_00700 [Ignavibacteriales bacterium UTCHB3]MBV6445090.1 hypothetical protein [Ignavibacteriaceae bacterium]